MLILFQTEEGFLDFDKFVGVQAEETDDGHGLVFAIGYDKLSILMGEYKNLDRAKEIVREIYGITGCISRYELPIV